MKDFFYDYCSIFFLLLLFFIAGLAFILCYYPNSKYVSDGVCCVCRENKKKTCEYKEINKCSSSETVITYIVCDDCIIDLCKKIKKDTPKEDKKDE